MLEWFLNEFKLKILNEIKFPLWINIGNVEKKEKIFNVNTEEKFKNSAYEIDMKKYQKWKINKNSGK